MRRGSGATFERRRSSAGQQLMSSAALAAVSNGGSRNTARRKSTVGVLGVGGSGGVSTLVAGSCGVEKKPVARFGNLESVEALLHGNRYGTTIHVINSGVCRLSKLTRSQTVYRGISGGLLPPSFWDADMSGIKGGTEMGFMSCTSDRGVALAYSRKQGRGTSGEVTNTASLLLESRMGMVDRGADLSWLSQFPQEAEYCFSPLTGIEVLGTRVEGDVLIVEAHFCTPANSTIDTAISRMQRSHLELVDLLISELSSSGVPSGLPGGPIRKLERLRIDSARRRPDHFNKVQNFRDATNEALSVQQHAFQSLADEQAWLEETNNVASRMRASADACARAGEQETALKLLQLTVERAQLEALAHPEDDLPAGARTHFQSRISSETTVIDSDRVSMGGGGIATATVAAMPATDAPTTPLSAVSASWRKLRSAVMLSQRLSKGISGSSRSASFQSTDNGGGDPGDVSSSASLAVTSVDVINWSTRSEVGKPQGGRDTSSPSGASASSGRVGSRRRSALVSGELRSGFRASNVGLGTSSELLSMAHIRAIESCGGVADEDHWRVQAAAQLLSEGILAPWPPLLARLIGEATDPNVLTAFLALISDNALLPNADRTGPREGGLIRESAQAFGVGKEILFFDKALDQWLPGKVIAATDGPTGVFSVEGFQKPTPKQLHSLPRTQVLACEEAGACALLCHAAAAGHATLVEGLLRAGISPFVADTYATTPLHHAAHAGHADVCMLILTPRGWHSAELRGKMMRMTNRHGTTPLNMAMGHTAVRRIFHPTASDMDVAGAAHAAEGTLLGLVQRAVSSAAPTGENGGDGLSVTVEALERLLAAQPAALNQAGSTQVTLLMLAARGCRPDLVDVLISARADVHAESARGVTALLMAAEEGCVDAIRALHAAGASLDESSSQEANNEPSLNLRKATTALLSASMNGHAAAVRALLNLNADVNHGNDAGGSALMAACKGGHVEVVHQLIARGADVHAKDIRRDEGTEYATTNTALTWAVFNGHHTVVEALLQADADANALLADDGTTTLMIACERGYEGIALTLIPLTADTGPVSISRNPSETQHRAAISPGSAPGRGIDGHTTAGETALTLACKNGHSGIVSALLAADAAVDGVTTEMLGMTPLMVAAKQGHVGCVEVLLDNGVAINAGTPSDPTLTALVLAYRCGHGALAIKLLQVGAKVELEQSEAAEAAGAHAAGAAAAKRTTSSSALSIVPRTTSAAAPSVVPVQLNLAQHLRRAASVQNAVAQEAEQRRKRAAEAQAAAQQATADAVARAGRSNGTVEPEGGRSSRRRRSSDHMVQPNAHPLPRSRTVPQRSLWDMVRSDTTRVSRSTSPPAVRVLELYW